jgi:2-phospho-L-lactate guanylyltransferase
MSYKMNVWAIVPVKPLSRAKSRLSEALLPEQREQLATELLARTVRLLVPLTQIRGVLVISRDTKALALVRELGANTVQESGAPELNNALLRAPRTFRCCRQRMSRRWFSGDVIIIRW